MCWGLQNNWDRSNGFQRILYQFTTRKSLKTVARFPIILQSPVCIHMYLALIPPTFVHVCVCMCVCRCLSLSFSLSLSLSLFVIDIHTCITEYIIRDIWVFIDAYMHICKHTYIHTCTYVNLHTYIHALLSLY